MKLITCLLLCCSSVIAEDSKIPPSQFTADGHTTDKLSVVKERLKDETSILLDVREQAEWNDGHLAQAKLIPLSVIKTGNLTKDMEKVLVKDKPIYVHCAAGGRVLTVSKLLRAKGYDIRPLRDGYSKLLDAGFAKAKPPVEPNASVPQP
mgnify:CR=1 FL=1|jgi:phage shock protein E